MADTIIQTPYSTALPFLSGDIPTWLNEYDAQRLASYDLYDDLYDNSPVTQHLLRGDNDAPIFVPTVKRIVNTLSRFVGRGWGYEVDPKAGTPAQQEAVKLAFSNLFRRERILSEFSNGKKEWLRRGDWVWMITGDPNKPEGKRLSVKTIHPRTLFWLFDANDADRKSGVEIVEETMLEDGETPALKIQRWLKANHPDHPSYNPDPEAEETDDEPIVYESLLAEFEDWEDPEKRVVLEYLRPQEPLEGIFALPIYSVKNGTSTANPYGESEIKGIESIIAAINQTISDEDLALAIAGLGMFVTDGGGPINEQTNQTEPWNLGPLEVVEVGAGKKFERIEGIKSIEPSQSHIDYLEEQAFGISGINDIALGTRGAVTESGIALAIRMAPLFDNGDEKDLQINDTFTQMFYDLQTMWFPAYESQNFGDVIVTSATDTGDRLPFDRKARWDELLAGFEANIFSLEFVHTILVRDFGYELGAAELKAALAQAGVKAAQADPYGARSDAELNAEDEDETDGGAS